MLLWVGVHRTKTMLNWSCWLINFTRNLLVRIITVNIALHQYNANPNLHEQQLSDQNEGARLNSYFHSQTVNYARITWKGKKNILSDSSTQKVFSFTTVFPFQALSQRQGRLEGQFFHSGSITCSHNVLQRVGGGAPHSHGFSGGTWVSVFFDFSSPHEKVT